jgi:hypothetical protein
MIEIIKNKLIIKNLKINVRGLKKIKKQRNLNIEEHYKIENDHYHDYEL